MQLTWDIVEDKAQDRAQHGTCPMPLFELLALLAQVKGHGNETYLVFPRHFCTCQSYHFDVLSKSDAICVSGVLPGHACV
jgi:hypothetical protein